MTFQSLNLGLEPNDGTGDDLRTAGGKINANFDALFNRVALATTEAAGLMSPEDKARLDRALTEIALATTEVAGLMSAEDKARLDRALTEAGLATPKEAGLMSPEDKKKLDGIAAGVNVVGTGITAIVALTQAAYDALDAPDANTLYVIKGAS